MMDLSDMTSITFSLKACRHVTIHLSGDYIEDSLIRPIRPIMVEFTFGSNGNTQSKIQLRTSHPGPGSGLIVVDTLDILDCDNYRDFWISWDQNRFKAGRGLVVGEQVIRHGGKTMVKIIHGTYKIQRMLVWNGYGSSAIYKFNAGKQLHLSLCQLFCNMCN